MLRELSGVLPSGEVNIRFYMPNNVRARGDMILGSIVSGTSYVVPRPSNEEPIVFIGKTKKGVEVEFVMSSVNQFWRSAHLEGIRQDSWNLFWNVLADEKNRDMAITVRGRLYKSEPIQMKEVEI